MGLQGYVGGAEDVQRIRRQEKQREEEKKKFEEKKKRSDANVDAAGLKTFGAGKLEVRLARPCKFPPVECLTCAFVGATTEG